MLAHGFPELAYSWRHQIPALAAAGYRVLAPDQRGYGRSSRPEAIEDYDIVHLTDDLLGLLDDVGAEKAVFVGHDWGSMVVWQLALLAPRAGGRRGRHERAVHAPGADAADPDDAPGLRRQLLLHRSTSRSRASPTPTSAATRPRRCAACSAALTVRTATPIDPAAMSPPDGRGFVDRMPEPDGLPDWLTQDELDHYVAEFARTGFTGGINWYRNFDRNWELTPQLAGAKVEVPSLFIGGALDPVLVMSPPASWTAGSTDHRGNVIVDGAGHWVQQEKPDEVNAALLDFLDASRRREGS